MTVVQILFSMSVAVLTSSFSTFLSWLFVYRHDSYKSQTAQIEKKKKELEELKKKADDDNKQNAKRKKRLEEQIASYSKSISMMSLKTMWIGPLILFVVNRFMANYFNGVVVAKLPFTPIWPVQALAHSRLETEDMTDCSNQFIYTLSAILIRDIINRWFGFSNPSFANMMPLAGNPNFQSQFQMPK